MLCCAVVLQCQVGDVVRATTAYTMQMTYPTMQLMFGGETSRAATGWDCPHQWSVCLQLT
jgi:hypothetical protein